MNDKNESHEHQECHHLLESLSAYVDGELSEALCTEIQQHMQECEDCRIVVDTLQKTVYLYHASNTPAAVPAGVRERLYKCLDLEEFIEDRPDQAAERD